jgi:hypothetical protein
VIQILPNLQKLDNVEITSEERQEAQSYVPEEAKSSKAGVGRKQSYGALKEK